MNIDFICAMIVFVITTTASVIIFLGFDHKFEKGFREGYTKGRTVGRYEYIENDCRNQSQRTDISEKQKDYLRWRANCYKDIINDLKKGIDDGIS